MHEETAYWGRSDSPPALLSPDQAAVIRMFGPSVRLSARDIEDLGVLRVGSALGALKELVAFGLLHWDSAKATPADGYACLAVAGIPAR